MTKCLVLSRHLVMKKQKLNTLLQYLFKVDVTEWFGVLARALVFVAMSEHQPCQCTEGC